MGKKALEELVFHDDFMFAAVMMDAENCRCFLERVLEMKIGRVEISREHGFFFNPENKSIRMDVFAKDEDQTHYDIEMQLVKKDSLERRSRYYHSQMDVEMLEKGRSYSELADAYVIFICDFDPLGQKKCRYTIRKYCEETGNAFGDGVCTIFLNTNGARSEVPEIFPPTRPSNPSMPRATPYSVTAVPNTGISLVPACAACRAGVAFARIRSTLLETKLLIIVEQVLESPCAFCSSKVTASPSASVNASLNPWVAASNATCCTSWQIPTL